MLNVSIIVELLLLTAFKQAACFQHNTRYFGLNSNARNVRQEALLYCPNFILELRNKQKKPAFSSLAASSFNQENEEATITNSAPKIYKGPILSPDAEIVAGVTLAELGLDLCIAPSTIAPAGLGIFARVASFDDVYDIQQVTVPSMTLLCGYSRNGSFEAKDIGDKTVGFFLYSPNTAVFYNQQLVSIFDALLLAGSDSSSIDPQEVPGQGTLQLCGLAGHAITLLANDGNEIVDQIGIEPVDDGFARYFVPSGVNAAYNEVENEDPSNLYCIQNYGQFGNDLAWDYSNPPKSKEDYLMKSMEANALQLVWRMEFDAVQKCLRPSWPVTVIKHDATFDNKTDFMELGTQYGWAYWQATVELDKV